MRISKWEKKRQKKKRRMRRPKTERGWINHWRRSIKVICYKATDLLHDREVYRTYLNTISENAALDKKNEFFFLLEKMYLEHMLMALRTFDDTDLRSHSLYNLIEEILDNPRVITRAWFVRGYQKRFRQFGERDFSERWGKGPYLSKQGLRADLRVVKTACKNIRTVVNKWIAHNARRQRTVRLTYGEIDKAADTIYDVMKRYYLLLFRAAWTG